MIQMHKNNEQKRIHSMTTAASSCVNMATTIIKKLNCFQPVMLLAARLLIARVFFASGMLKISDWASTVELFTNEHPVPFFPPEIAAFLGVTFELACPILLTLGLASRVATLPLLAMTAVINFTYQDAFEHYFWAAALGTILCYGPGKMSLDAIFARKYIKGI